ncbi:RNA polymerase sigma-70 factor, ECF subfamily [Amycolatopsis marina]|uniref:RNA polymerase sigma-70 factor, ECF subfamily n=1 Tax=Amycolatopsis marina TaxID=490629 RepID=A0A1I1AVM8_9PSEU|nr:sigma-70 family RNA polymerase sigma factor [Amycolatopsis marina]SFB41937.1 RNA polymerase sigma-70 factor, ECF subfamily [Amycolatopsis marina]
MVSGGGSPGDFERFFREDYGRLIAYLRKSGFSAVMAEDAAAEAMAKVMEAWDDVEHAGAWVRTIARRYACQQLKRLEAGLERARSSEWAGSAGNGHRDQHDGPESSVLRDEQILSLLSRLPRRQREVMALVFEERDNEEIADDLRISEATVRSNLRHARKRLKRIYEREYRADSGDGEEQGDADDES